MPGRRGQDKACSEAGTTTHAAGPKALVTQRAKRLVFTLSMFAVVVVALEWEDQSKDKSHVTAFFRGMGWGWVSCFGAC